MLVVTCGFTPLFTPNSQLTHVRDVVDNSLGRLGVDYIDVLQHHIHDPAVPIEDVVGVMKARTVHPISVVQASYSTFDRKSESLFAVLVGLQIRPIPYRRLAWGFLTGPLRPPGEYPAGDFRHNNPWWAQDLASVLQAIYPTLSHALPSMPDNVRIMKPKSTKPSDCQ